MVELPENRELLKRFEGIVVHVMREKEKVLEYLRTATHFPSYYHETAVEAWERRKAWFSACCSYEFVSLTVDIPPSSLQDGVTPEQTLALKPVEEDFFRLLRFIHGLDTNKVPLRTSSHTSSNTHPLRTYFLCLTYPDITQALPVLEDLSYGIDLWELRVDFLRSMDLTFLAFQVALLKRHSSLPILFNLRTVGQDGRYPDLVDGDHESYDRLESILLLALRLGVEYLALSITLPPKLFSLFTSLTHPLSGAYRSTTTIGSYHVPIASNPVSWTGGEMRKVYDELVRREVGIVMMTGVARRFEDNLELRAFVGGLEMENGGKRKPPLIAVNILPEVTSPSLRP